MFSSVNNNQLKAFTSLVNLFSLWGFCYFSRIILLPCSHLALKDHNFQPPLKLSISLEYGVIMYSKNKTKQNKKTKTKQTQKQKTPLHVHVLF